MASSVILVPFMEVWVIRGYVGSAPVEKDWVTVTGRVNVDGVEREDGGYIVIQKPSTSELTFLSVPTGFCKSPWISVSRHILQSTPEKPIPFSPGKINKLEKSSYQVTTNVLFVSDQPLPATADYRNLCPAYAGLDHLVPVCRICDRAVARRQIVVNKQAICFVADGAGSFNHGFSIADALTPSQEPTKLCCECKDLAGLPVSYAIPAR